MFTGKQHFGIDLPHVLLGWDWANAPGKQRLASGVRAEPVALGREVERFSIQVWSDVMESHSPSAFAFH